MSNPGESSPPPPPAFSTYTVISGPLKVFPPEDALILMVCGPFSSPPESQTYFQVVQSPFIAVFRVSE